MKKRIAVIGAGISGLTCAYELQKAGFEVVVYEKENFVGGRMATRENNGFLFDIGANHLVDLYTEMRKYCQKFGIEWEDMRFLKYEVVKKGEIHAQFKAIGLKSKLRLLKLMQKKRKDNNFLNLSTLAEYDTDNAYDYMAREVGQDVADYIVDAFSTTYQFHRADEISIGVLFGVMDSIKLDKVGWNMHRTKGGMSALPNAFAERLDVRLGEAVNEIPEGFDAVVMACTATTALKILKNPSDSQRDLLENTKYSSSVSVAFKLDKAKMPETSVLWVPFVESEIVSGIVNESMKGEELMDGEKTLMCTWLHEDFARSVMNKSDDEIYSLVKEELVRVCPWFSELSDLDNFDLQRWPEAMPKFYHGHLKRVAAFKQGENNIFFTGDYLNSPWTEGALRCGQRVAKLVAKSL